MQNIIRLPEVQRRTGYSKAWIYRLIALGEFPKQIKLGVKSVGFVESEINEWIDNKINSSRNGEVNKQSTQQE